MAGIPRIEEFGDIVTVEMLEEEYDEHFEPTENEIIEQCRAMGIDLVREPDLIYIAKEALKAPLPSNWRPVSTREGEIFYYDAKTGESAWEHPCDTYYQNLLEKERNKKATQQRMKSSKSKSVTGGNNRGPLGGVTTPINTSELESIEKKDFHVPGSLSLSKPPVLAPIGSSLSQSFPMKLNMGGTLPPLKPLSVAQPSLRGDAGLILNASNAPLLSNTGPGVVPPHTTGPSDVSPHTTGPSNASNVTGSKATMNGESGDSTLVVPSSLKPSYPPLLSTNIIRSPPEPDPLNIDELSNRYEEENDSDDSQVEENSFERKYNVHVMGLDGLPASNSSSASATENSSDDKRKETKESPPHKPSSYFMKSSKLQEKSSPSHTPMGSPSLRPGAARGTRTKSSLHQQQNKGAAPVIIPNTTSSDALLKMDTSSSDDNSVTDTRDDLGQGNMDRKHQELLEKIKQDHSRELELLKTQFQSEIKLEKEELAKEKIRKLALSKEQMDVELERERNKIEKQHKERLEGIKKTIKEEQDEEEAKYQEKKEDSLRDIKRKIAKEQHEEEQELKKVKDSVLAEMKRDIEKEKAKLEQESMDARDKEISNLKAALEADKEALMAELRNKNNETIRKLKDDLKDRLETDKKDLLLKHQQEMARLKESLREEHEAMLEVCRKEVADQFEQRKKEVEKDRALQLKAIEEEIRVSLELKKKELEEKLKEEMVILERTHETNIAEIKQKQGLEIGVIQQDSEQDIMKLKLEKSEELNKLQRKHDEAASDMEEKMTQLAEEKRKIKEEMDKLNREKDTLNRKTVEMRATMKELETQVTEKKRILKESPPATKGDKLLPEIGKSIRTEEKKLKEIKNARDILSIELSELQRKKQLLQQECNNTARNLPDTPPHQATPSLFPQHATPSSQPPLLMRHPPHNDHAHPIINDESNLIFSNHDTLLFDEEENDITMTTTVKSNMTSSSSCDEDTSESTNGEGKGAGPGDVVNSHPAIPSLRLSELQTPHKATTNQPPPNLDPVLLPPRAQTQPLSSPTYFPATAPSTNYHETNDMWMKVKSQIEQESHALLELEQSFTSGPVRQLERLERILADMNNIKEAKTATPSSGDHLPVPPPVPNTRNPYSTTTTSSSTWTPSVHTTPPHCLNPNHHLQSRQHSNLLIEDLENTKGDKDAVSEKELQLSVTLDRISGQLGEVLHRLGETQPDTNDNRHYVCNDGGNRFISTTSRSKYDYDKELHDKWQEYLDQAAQDDNYRRESSQHQPSIYDPPVGKTKTDVAGHSLVQRQKDWLKEFKMNVPPLRKHHGSLFTNDQTRYK